MKLTFFVLITAMGLGACTVTQKLGMRETTVPAYLLLAGNLYVGQAHGFSDRSASLDVRNPDSPANTCSGSLKFTGENSGQVELTCTGGVVARLIFKSLTWSTGFAYGDIDAGVSSLTFGLTPENAVAYLRVPVGKRLAVGKRAFLGLGSADIRLESSEVPQKEGLQN